MDISINKYQANVIQVALDHLNEEHSDIMLDAIKNEDKEMAEFSLKIKDAILIIQKQLRQL